MTVYTTDTRGSGGRRQYVVTGLLVVLAVFLTQIPGEYQEDVADVLTSTVLRPFVLTQEGLSELNLRAARSDELEARLDSLVAVLGARTSLAEENRRLKDLLSLLERTGPAFRPASVIRAGTLGSESMFLLDVGYEDGVREDAPVLTPTGLMGAVREVRAHSAIGMDWTHPEFRASAMTIDGRTYGLVEVRRGRFREEDRLLLNGAPFHALLETGTPVVTSGLGGVFPRGIAIGTVEGLAEAEGGWRKAYWLRPSTEPGRATHVLVAVEGAGEVPGDLSALWPADSILHERYVAPRVERERRRAEARVPDSLLMAVDSVGGGLRARGSELFRSEDGTPSVVFFPREEETRGSGARAGAGAAGVGTPEVARPEPRPEARPAPPDPRPSVGGDTAAAPPVDTVRVRPDTADTARRPPPDTTRPPPDTTPPPPDTNRTARRDSIGGAPVEAG